MTGPEIMARMIAAYARVPRYRDSGRMRTQVGCNAPIGGSFRTDFERSRRLRFDYEGWGLESEVVIHWDGHSHDAASIIHTLGAHAGVTFGASCYVPQLLGLLGKRGLWPWQANDAVHVASETIANEPCHVVTTVGHSFHISERDDFMRRIVSDHTTIEYDVLNA